MSGEQSSANTIPGGMKTYTEEELVTRQQERLPEGFRIFKQEDINIKVEDLSEVQNLSTTGQFSAVSKAKLGEKIVCIKKMDVEDPIYAYVEMALLRDSANKHIVNFYGALLMDNKLAMVSEFMERGDVKAALKDDIEFFRQRTHAQDLKFNWKQRLRVAEHTARALKEIHDVGVVHRDIKTENLLLTGRGRRMTCKLADFGFARGLLEQSSERAQTICGTEELMAPEMLMCTPYSTAVDTYSYGLVLVELICGRGPTPPGETYEGAAFLERLPENFFDISFEEVDNALIAGCPVSLFELAKQCLEYEPEQRLTAGEVVDWIEDLHQDLAAKNAERVPPARLPNALQTQNQKTMQSQGSAKTHKTAVGRFTLRKYQNTKAKRQKTE